jgi:hypothetical protein
MLRVLPVWVSLVVLVVLFLLAAWVDSTTPLDLMS